jgi:uroporphyrinogen decarboxylase
MTGRERLLTALRRQTPDCVPTFEWFIDETVTRALTGHADVLDAAETLDLDAVNVRPDYAKRHLNDTTFVDEWGATRAQTGECLPCVVASPIHELAKHRAYRFPDPEAPGRFATLERALRLADGRRAVLLNLRDGFSDVRDLLGYEEALVQVKLEPERYAELLDRAVEYNLALARLAVRRYGIEVLATTDDVADTHGPLISPASYFEVIGPAFRKAIRGYRELGCHVIKHCDGNVRPLIEFWVECGIDCLDPIDPRSGLSLPELKRTYGDRLCFKGNIDCAGVLQYGTVEDVEQAVRECLRAAGRAGLILSSSNSIHRGVKPENYGAMLRALRRFGRDQAPVVPSGCVAEGGELLQR